MNSRPGDRCLPEDRLRIMTVLPCAATRTNQAYCLYACWAIMRIGVCIVRRRAGHAVCVTGAVFAAALALLAAPAAKATPIWTVQPTPNPVMPNGLIQGMSCVTSEFCAAVGSYDNGAGVYGPLALTWDGHSWHLRDAVDPNPTASSQNADFTGVSCLSASFCMAVGSTDAYGLTGVSGFAELWNGAAWRPEPFAKPTGSTGWNVDAVSCVTRTFCEAVGVYATPSLQNDSLAERWNGTRWAVQPSPNQAGQYTDTELTSVSCVSARFCQATDDAGPLIEQWNGRKWSGRTLPDSDGFTVVSCTSAAFCQALGRSNTGLISERWNGTAWRRTVIQTPAAEPHISAVSCRSATFCEAVGYDNVTGTGAYYAAEWDGKSWHARDLPVPAVAYQGSLNAVSCVSGHYCLAAGASLRPVQALIFNGKSWSTARTLILDGAVSNYLYSVSCLSAIFCEAAGVSDMNPSGLPEMWNGRTWNIQANSSLYARFNSVSCVSRVFCEAVGDQAARWDGTAWTYQPMPATFYKTVSCGSASFCVAVGPGNAAVWNGTMWSATSLPDENTASYVSVSCVSATFCETVGDTSLDGPGAAAQWNGRSWKTQPVPGPPGSTGVNLTALSCATSTSCELTGSTRQGSFTDGWDGTSWKEQGLLPVPSGSAGVLPSALSCPSATNCTLAGDSLTSSESEQALIEGWDGATWTIQTTSAAAGSVLSGVSCLANGHCEAVGSQPGGLVYRTLAVTSG